MTDETSKTPRTDTLLQWHGYKELPPLEQRYAIVCSYLLEFELALAEANEWAKFYEYLRAERENYLDGKPFIGVHTGGSFSVWTDEHADTLVKAAMKEKP